MTLAYVQQIFKPSGDTGRAGNQGQPRQLRPVSGAQIASQQSCPHLTSASVGCKAKNPGRYTRGRAPLLSAASRTHRRPSVPHFQTRRIVPRHYFGMNWNENANLGVCKLLKRWWPERDSNPRRQPFQGCALPPELPGHVFLKPARPPWTARIVRFTLIVAGLQPRNSFNAERVRNVVDYSKA